MAYYVLIDADNVVVGGFSGRDETEVVEGIDDWEVYYSTADLIAKRTSYNTRGGVHYDPETGEPSEDQSKAFRGNYAGVGFTYDEALDAFIPPKPFDSWTLDEATFSWVAPIPYPEDDGAYIWDEETQNWVEVAEEYE